MNKDEYGLIMLKPDGNQELYYECIKNKLKENKIEVVKERDVQLKSKDVGEVFFNAAKPDEYIKYMTSGISKAILVKGRNAGYRLYKIKKEVRGAYNYKKGDMKNLIHSPDNGNEYYYQFGILFPELDISKYCAFGDLNVILPKNKLKAIKQLETVENETNISCIAINMNVKEYNAILNKFHQKYRRLKTIIAVSNNYEYDNKTISVMGYLPEQFKSIPKYKINNYKDSIFNFISYIESFGGISVLGYLPSDFYTNRFIEKIKKIGIKGALVHDPRRSVNEAHLLDDRIHDEGLIFTGGSGGIMDIGKITIGERAVSKIVYIK